MLGDDKYQWNVIGTIKGKFSGSVGTFESEIDCPYWFHSRLREKCAYLKQ